MNLHGQCHIKIKNHKALGYFSAQLFRIRDGERVTMPDHFTSYGEALKGARNAAETFAAAYPATIKFSAEPPSRNAQVGA